MILWKVVVEKSWVSFKRILYFLKTYTVMLMKWGKLQTALSSISQKIAYTVLKFEFYIKLTTSEFVAV